MATTHSVRGESDELDTTVENGTFSTVPNGALSNAVQALRGQGLAPSSKLAYRQDIACWQSFMQQQGRPVTPVLAEDVAGFVVALLVTGSPAVPHPRPLARATVERRLAGLSTWCRLQGLPRPDLTQARDVLRGHERVHGSRAPARAAPLTVNVLRSLLDRVDADAEAGHPHRAERNRALVLNAFALGARRSEVVSLDITDITVTAEGALVTILRAKTRTRPDTIAIPYANQTRLCPVRALVTLRSSLAAEGTVDGPLFRRITAGDAVLLHRLKPAAVAQIIHGLAQAAALPVPDGFRSYSGHSARRGMATESRRAGTDPLTIARQGGWKDGSASLNVYLAEVDRWTDHALKGVL